MEEYERTRRGANAPRRVSPSLRPGQVTIDYPPMRILVTDATTPAGRAVVEAFRRFNCRVAITCADRREGTLLAQHTGAQYHPGTPPRRHHPTQRRRRPRRARHRPRRKHPRQCPRPRAHTPRRRTIRRPRRRRLLGPLHRPPRQRLGPYIGARFKDRGARRCLGSGPA